jgi:hypothetical protein
VEAEPQAMTPGCSGVGRLRTGSARHGGQADEGIIAQRGDGFQCHISGALHSPFVVLFEQQRTDEADDGLVIGEDADESVLRLIPPLMRSIGLIECNSTSSGIYSAG